MNEMLRILLKTNLRRKNEDTRNVQKKYFVIFALLVFDDLYLTSILLIYREKMVLDDDELISPEELSLKAREVSFNLIFSSVGGC